MKELTKKTTVQMHWHESGKRTAQKSEKAQKGYEQQRISSIGLERFWHLQENEHTEYPGWEGQVGASF